MVDAPETATQEASTEAKAWSVWPEDLAKPKKKLRASHVLEAVNIRLSLQPGEMREKRRGPSLTQGRALFALLCKELTHLSYPEIAQIATLSPKTRGHSTYIDAHKKLAARLGGDESKGKKWPSTAELRKMTHKMMRELVATVSR